MILKRVTPEELLTFLRQDFHKSEVKSLDTLKRLTEDGNYRIFFFYNGDEFVGYACLAGNFTPGGCVLLDYFAVNSMLRNKGYGTRMLKRLKVYSHRAGFSIIAEAEAPEHAPDAANREIRKRRIAFYTKSGAEETSVTSRVTENHYVVLMLEGKLSDEEFARFMEELYTHFFGVSSKDMVTIAVNKKQNVL